MRPGKAEGAAAAADGSRSTRVEASCVGKAEGVCAPSSPPPSSSRSSSRGLTGLRSGLQTFSDICVRRVPGQCRPGCARGCSGRPSSRPRADSRSRSASTRLGTSPPARRGVQRLVLGLILARPTTPGRGSAAPRHQSPLEARGDSRRVRYVCGVGFLLGLGVREPWERALRLALRHPRSCETRCVGWEAQPWSLAIRASRHCCAASAGCRLVRWLHGRRWGQHAACGDALCPGRCCGRRCNRGRRRDTVS